MFDEGKYAALLMNAFLGAIARLKWFFILIFYFVALSIFGLRAALVITVLIGASMFAYGKDREREAGGEDHFSGEWLFYRYGEELDRVYFSLPVKEFWDAKNTENFCDSLREQLAAAIDGHLQTGLAQVKGTIPITDRSTNETKFFLRILAKSRYGSMLSIFVHFAPFGKTITAHTFTYRRGTFSEWDVVKYAICGPFTMWFWGLAWLQNRHSIIASLSHFRASSFDGIDFHTLYAMSSEALGSEMAGILKLEGMITDEAAAQIVQHFHRVGNTLNIVNSKGVKIGDLSQGVGVHSVPNAS
ncbi:MAG TPA: hypothetical protein VN493_14810 [Thermoanaerobaculia bacterium]|nr:hypothetical protein [Thermoanaerobaculia bacterium]